MSNIKGVERSNFYRLSLLILDTGTLTLHCILKLNYSPNGSLQTFLQSKCVKLNKLYAQKVINRKQQQLLQPTSGSPLLEDLDISLVSKLLTNLCSIPQPQKGWTSPPAANDLSIGADILRLRDARNELFAHRVKGSINNVVYEQAWKDISAAITRLSKQLGKNEQEEIKKQIEEINTAHINWERENQINGLLYDGKICAIWDKLQEIKPDPLIVITSDEDQDLLFLFLHIPKGQDGIITVLKQYPCLKSNLTNNTGKAIAQCLLEEKLINMDEYNRITDSTCERRYQIDRLLKKVIRGGPEVLESFFNQLKEECPSSAISLSETRVTEEDRKRYKQVEMRFVDLNPNEITLNTLNYNSEDIMFAKNLLRDSPEVVDSVNDELISRFFINVGEHSKIIQFQVVDDKIHYLFVTMFSCHLPVELILQKTLEPEAFRTWTEFMKCKPHRMALESCLPTFERNLNFQSVFFHICQKNLLDEFTIQRIKDEAGTGQTRQLLKCFQERELSIYELFKECLVLSEHVELKDDLETYEAKFQETKSTDESHPKGSACVCVNIEMQYLYRVYLLLNEVGTQALQSFFGKHSYSLGGIQMLLRCEEVKIAKLQKQNIITERQRELLKSDFSFCNLDLYLLSILLMNLCKLTQPLKGWMVPPDLNDTSTGADILRLLKARKDVYIQCSEGGLTETDFQQAWHAISGSVLRLVEQFDPNQRDDFQKRIAFVYGKHINTTEKKYITKQIMKQMTFDISLKASSDKIILTDEDEDDQNTDSKQSRSLQSLLHWAQALPMSIMNYIFNPLRLIYKRTDRGSIVLKCFAGEDFTLHNLKPKFVAKQIRKLLKIGCFETEAQLRNSVHVTVSIMSQGFGEPDEIYFCIDFERTDALKSTEGKQEARLKAEEMKLMREEMDPKPLQQWLFGQLQIDSVIKSRFNDIALLNDLTRRDKMEILLEIINELDNGYNMLAKYCKENEAYIFNKVFEKTPMPGEKEREIHLESELSYKKGSGLQQLYSMWMDMDGDEACGKVVHAEIDTEESNFGRLMHKSSSFWNFEDGTWHMELEKYKNQMPLDIRIDYFDVLVLYSEDNKSEARKFCDHLKKDIKLKDDESVKAVLYDEFVPQAVSKLKLLQIALERCSYVFCYITKEFCEDKWLELFKEKCLMEVIENERNHVRVVPVFTVHCKTAKFQTPVSLMSIMNINYDQNDQNYRSRVSTLIQINLHHRLDKERKQKQQQFTWVMRYLENKEKLRTKQQEKEKITEVAVNEGLLSSQPVFLQLAGLQDIGCLSLNPDVDGMHSESDDQSQDSQMTPVNQSPSCWAIEAIGEKAKEQSLLTRSKVHRQPVKKTKEEKEHYSSLFTESTNLSQYQVYRRPASTLLTRAFFFTPFAANMTLIQSDSTPGKHTESGLQDIGCLSLNPDVDGMHSESDDQSQDNQMTPVNQSSSCWGTDAMVEVENEESLETKSKDHSMSVKKIKEEKEHYFSLSEKEFTMEMNKKYQDCHFVSRVKDSNEKLIAAVTPRLKVCRDGEKSDLDIVARETKCDTHVETIHETREPTLQTGLEETLPKIVNEAIRKISPCRERPNTDLSQYQVNKKPAASLLTRASVTPFAAKMTLRESMPAKHTESDELD